MKIRATCKRDGREFMIEQAVASGGACPWDGEPFNADYAATLVDALERAELAGTEFEEVLRTIADLDPDFSLLASSVLDPIREQVVRLEQRSVRKG